MRKAAVLLSGLMILIFVIGSPLSVGSMTAVSVGSTLWSAMQDVAVNGNYAYCSMEKGLVVVDISNLSETRFVSQIAPDSGMALGSMIAGNYLYVAFWSGGMGIYDVNDPASPNLVGRINPGGYINDVFVQGNYAYLSDRYGFFYVVDISAPSSPQLMTTLSGFNGAFAVKVIDTVAYLGTSSGLVTINVASPDTSIFISICSTQTRVYDIAIANGIAYVACESKGLQVIAMPRPDDMYILGGYGIIGGAYGVDVAGDVAYLARYDYSSGIVNSGLMAFDITNPEVPTLIGLYRDPYGLKVSIKDSIAFVADRTLGLQLINILHPPSFGLIGEYRTQESRCVAIAGNRAYVAGNGFSIIDISDNSNPIVLGQIPFDYTGMDVAVVDTLAFVTGYFTSPYSNTGQFAIISITDDQNPYVISSTSLPKAGFSLAIQGNYAYLGGYDSLQIFDISNPLVPVIVSYFPQRCDYIAVRGDFAYIPHLKILNISNPLSPHLEGEDQIGGAAADIVLRGDTAFVCAWTGELMMGFVYSFDISNPAAPLMLDYDYTGDDAFCMELKNNFAIVGTYGGLYYFDITDPAAIVSSGHDAVWGYVSDIAVAGGYGYLAVEDGLQIVRFQGTCCDLPGDFTNNDLVNILDVTAMIDNLYKGGPPAACVAEADANGSGVANIQDITYLIKFLYLGGPTPICGPI
ncbi:MAG: hypothetical protein NT002_01215 [candidate division Zixibacteria bacterium]|nr:hypothetical protein [candidate division Zixibacteria bacterium]